MTLYNPEDDVVEMRLPETGLSLTKWTSYRFDSAFLTPTDGFNFEVPERFLTDAEKEALVEGAKVQLLVAGHVQATGFIESIDTQADRGSGAVWHIDGTDVLGPAVHATMDPATQFKKDQTLADVLKAIFEPFGFAQFDTDNDANRGVLTGQTRGTKTSQKGKTLKGQTIYALHPHQGEGCFAFAARIAQRHGMHIWASADGSHLVVGKPDFSTAPVGTLRRTTTGPNNILRGGVKRDITDQPHLIVADGASGGQEFGKSRIRAMMLHPAMHSRDSSVVDAALEKYGKMGATTVRDETFDEPYPEVKTPHPRVVYLHDEESHTQEQLENYVRREMSVRLRKYVTAKYTVKGHQTVNKHGELVPINVDTMLRVEDEVSRGLDIRMYVARRTFHRARGARGSSTDVELVLPYSILF